MSKKTITPFRSTVKAASGAGVLIGALIALAFFRGGIGLGEGDGKEGGDALTSVSDSDKVATPTKAPVKPEEASEDGLSDEERMALSSGQLTLLIDERSYLVKTGEGDSSVYQPIEIARALELAGRTTGDANGIRVVIQRRESSRASAESELKSALQNAGIDENAVQMPGSFIP